MDAFLLAVASGHPMRPNSQIQPKSSSSLPKPSQSIPPRPPAPTSKKTQSWAATAAGPPANIPPASSSSRPNTTHHPSRAPVPKQSATTKRPKAMFRLSEEAPLLRADTTAIKAAFIHIVPDLKVGIASVTRCANGFNVIFSSDALLKIAMDNADSIKASLSGSLTQLENRKKSYQCPGDGSLGQLNKSFSSLFCLFSLFSPQ